MYPYSLSLTFTADEVSFGALDGIAEVKQAIAKSGGRLNSR